MKTAAEIAEHLGLDRHPRSWRGRCPACDYTTTFSVRSGRDGRALLFCANCRDPKAIFDAVACAVGENRQPERRAEADAQANRARNQERAMRMWRGSESPLGTPASAYLSNRGLACLVASAALRFRSDTPHPEGGRYPALVALVTAADGAPLAVHRTYLSREGRKANISPVKASLGPIWGGAVRLHDLDPDRPVVIGEGIESTASAGVLMDLPSWAAMSAGNLANGLVLPPNVRRVVIATDPDEAGRAAASEAWARWTAEGREVRFVTPDGTGDFNDLLMAKERTDG